MKKIILLPLWFISSLIFTSACIYGIQQVRGSSQATAAPTVQQDTKLNTAYNLSQGEVKGLSTVYETDDARPEIIAKFLARHDSPLVPHTEYAQKIVDISDKYNIDYRLLPAIAMQESNICKKIPSNSYNCLGFGITSKGTLRFSSYEEAFETAAKSLKKNYIDRGLTTPEKIMSKYTPSSNGSWANSVNQWIAEMEYDSKDMGREMKSDANLVEYVAPTPTILPQ